MNELINFKKIFIETYKDTNLTIEEIKKIISQSNCNSLELTAIIEAIISYRNDNFGIKNS